MARLWLILLTTALLAIGSVECFGLELPCILNKFNKTCISVEDKAVYDDIVDLKYKFDVLLIDVRTPEEVLCTGMIPTSINIPLAHVADELFLMPNVFICKYGRKKPALNDMVIFYCRSGNRAARAALMAFQMGFRKVKNYVGSWIEYATLHGLPLDCSSTTTVSMVTASTTPAAPITTSTVLSTTTTELATTTTELATTTSEHQTTTNDCRTTTTELTTTTTDHTTSTTTTELTTTTTDHTTSTTEHPTTTTEYTTTTTEYSTTTTIPPSTTHTSYSTSTAKCSTTTKARTTKTTPAETMPPRRTTRFPRRHRIFRIFDLNHII